MNSYVYQRRNYGPILIESHAGVSRIHTLVAIATLVAITTVIAIATLVVIATLVAIATLVTIASWVVAGGPRLFRIIIYKAKFKSQSPRPG